MHTVEQSASAKTEENRRNNSSKPRAHFSNVIQSNGEIRWWMVSKQQCLIGLTGCEHSSICVLHIVGNGHSVRFTSLAACLSVASNIALKKEEQFESSKRKGERQMPFQNTFQKSSRMLQRSRITEALTAESKSTLNLGCASVFTRFMGRTLIKQQNFEVGTLKH